MSGTQHFDHELAELDRQIVRMGNLCGFDVTQDAVATSVMNGEVSADNLPAELRKTFALLKGLLTLRYIVEKQCVDDIGPSHGKQILDATILK